MGNAASSHPCQAVRKHLRTLLVVGSRLLVLVAVFFVGTHQSFAADDISKLSIKVQTSGFLSTIAVPTDTGRFVGGRIEWDKEERKPAAGRVFLVLTLAINNTASPINLTLRDVTLRGSPSNTQSAEMYTPFFWEKSVIPGLASAQGDAFSIGANASLDIVVDVPSNTDLLKLTLWIRDQSMGSLESLGMKADIGIDLILPATDAKETAPPTFGVGSTREEVIAAQGSPDAETTATMYYGSSRVFLSAGRVTSWRDATPKLRLAVSPVR
jgi:hypothetical protein